MVWDVATGWYIKQVLGGIYKNIVFRETVAANAVGDLTIDDAVNGASLKSAMQSGALVVTDVVSYSSASVVAVDVKPDGLVSERFTIDALKTPIHRLIQPPKSCEVGITITYENEAVPTDLYLNFGVIQFTDQGITKFDKFATGIADLGFANVNLFSILSQDKEITKALVNIALILQQKTPTEAVSTVTTVAAAEEVRRERCRR